VQNLKVYLYVFGLTAVVAILLAGLQVSLKDIHEANEAIATKRDILGAVVGSKKAKKLTDDEVLESFKSIEQIVVDVNGLIVEGVNAEKLKLADEEKKPEADRHYPIFIRNSDAGKEYVLAMRGNGLWDKIWGYIAVKSDFTTVVGVSFDHKSETPGLGALIKDSDPFKAKFIGTKVFNEEGVVALKVKKGGAVDKTYEVDGITGATVTCDGVSSMLANSLSKYKPFIVKQGISFSGDNAPAAPAKKTTTEETAPKVAAPDTKMPADSSATAGDEQK